MKRFLRALLIVTVIVFLAYRIVTQMDHNSAYGREINVVLGVFAFFVLMAVWLVDQRQFSQKRTLIDFLPSCIGFALAIVLVCGLVYLHHRDKSPTVLFALGEENALVGISIDLREDNTYKISNWGLGVDFYRGHYELTNDSILNLDNKIKGLTEIKSPHMLIRTQRVPGRQTLMEKLIYQVDDKGVIIPDALHFKVIKKEEN